MESELIFKIRKTALQLLSEHQLQGGFLCRILSVEKVEGFKSVFPYVTSLISTPPFRLISCLKYHGKMNTWEPSNR